MPIDFVEEKSGIDFVPDEQQESPRTNRFGETRSDLERQMREARAEGLGDKAILGLADLGERAAYTLADALGRADVTGITGNILGRQGVQRTPTLLQPEDVGTVGQFISEGLHLPTTAPVEASQGVVPDILKGAKEFGTEMAVGLSDPGMIAMGGATSKIPREMGRLFQLQMAAGLPQGLQDVAAAETLPEAVKSGLGVAANVAFPAMIEKGLQPKLTPVPDIPGRVLPSRKGAIPPRGEPSTAIETVTPEQAKIAAEQMTEKVAAGVEPTALVKVNLPEEIKVETKPEVAAEPTLPETKPEPTPTAEPAKAQGKQPWEITKDEFNKDVARINEINKEIAQSGYNPDLGRERYTLLEKTKFPLQDIESKNALENAAKAIKSGFELDLSDVPRHVEIAILTDKKIIESIPSVTAKDVKGIAMQLGDFLDGSSMDVDIVDLPALTGKPIITAEGPVLLVLGKDIKSTAVKMPSVLSVPHDPNAKPGSPNFNAAFDSAVRAKTQGGERQITTFNPNTIYVLPAGDFKPENPAKITFKPAISHQHLVEQALSEGKPVPAEVLKDYPELAPKPEPTRPSEVSPTSVSESKQSSRLSDPEESALASVPEYVSKAYREYVKARDASDAWFENNPPPSRGPRPGTMQSPQTGQAFEAAKSRWTSRDEWEAASRSSQKKAEELRREFLELNAIRNNVRGASDPKQALLKYANKFRLKQSAPPTTAVTETKPSGVGETQPTPEAKPIGMGGAIPEEFAKGQGSPTAMKYRLIDEERRKRGLEPLTTIGKRSDQAMMDRALTLPNHDSAAPGL